MKFEVISGEEYASENSSLIVFAIFIYPLSFALGLLCQF
jgi:hypothetical protein